MTALFVQPLIFGQQIIPCVLLQMAAISPHLAQMSTLSLISMVAQKGLVQVCLNWLWWRIISTY